VALPLAVERPAAQQARGAPGARVVKQKRQAQHPAKSRCLQRRLQIIEAPRPLKMRRRQLGLEFRRAAASVRLRTGDPSAPWALVPARPNSHIECPVVGRAVWRKLRGGKRPRDLPYAQPYSWRAPHPRPQRSAFAVSAPRRVYGDAGNGLLGLDLLLLFRT
jgi:hypothetical protein